MNWITDLMKSWHCSGDGERESRTATKSVSGDRGFLVGFRGLT